MSRDWFRDGISRAMDNNDDDAIKLLNQLQLIEDMEAMGNFQYGDSRTSKRDLLESMESLYKCSRKASLTRDVIKKTEKAIERMKSQCDKNIHYSYDYSKKETLKKLYHRTSATHAGGYDRHQSRKEESKETTKRVRSWTTRSDSSPAKNERREEVLCISDTSDDTSKSSHSDRRGRSRHRRQRKETEVRGYTPDRDRRKYCDRTLSRSPPRYTPYEAPRRYYDLTSDRSISRSPIRRRSVTPERRRRYDGGDKQRRSRSKCRRESNERYRSSSSEERGGKCTGRSRSKGRHDCHRSKCRRESIGRRRSADRRAGKREERSKERNRSKYRSTPRSIESVKTEPWELSSESGSCYGNQEPTFRNGVNFSVCDALRKKIQSALSRSDAQSEAKSADRNEAAEPSTTDSSSQSNLYGWQGEFDLNGESTWKSSVNLSVTTEVRNQRANFVNQLNDNNQRQPQNDGNKLALERTKIEFSFAKSMKDKKLKANRAFEDAATDNAFGTSAGATTENLTDVQSRLTDLIMTALESRMNEERDTSTEDVKPPPETIVIDDCSIDNEIIQRITSKPIEEPHSASPYESRIESKPHSVSPCESTLYQSKTVDSVKQTIAAAKDTRVAKPQRYATKHNLLPAPVKLPIPSIKFLTANTFQRPVPRLSKSSSKPTIKCLPPTPFATPALPRHIGISPKPSSDIALPSNAAVAKNRIAGRRLTSFVQKKQKPGYYGNFDWLTYTIPKKTINYVTSVTTSAAISDEHSEGNRFTVEVKQDDDAVFENYVNLSTPSPPPPPLLPSPPPPPPPQSLPMQNRNNHSTGNETLLEAVHNPSKGKRSNTSSSASGNSSIVRGPMKVTVNRKQKPQAVRSRSLSPTLNCEEITFDGSLLKPLKIGEKEDVKLATFKNVNPEWHSERKIVQCQVCDKPHGNSLVSHYVNDHPQSEVLISRLSPEVAERLRAQSDITECEVKRIPQIYFKQICYFCNVHKTFQRRGWIDHIARHTGYYRFKCKHCSRLMACKPQAGTCYELNSYEVIPQPQFDRKYTSLPAYVCDLCNYVRLHKHEMEAHLVNEHGHDDPTTFKEFIFLSFPKTKSRKTNTMDDFLANLTDLESESKYGGSESDEDWELDETESDEDSESHQNEWETAGDTSDFWESSDTPDSDSDLFV